VADYWEHFALGGRCGSGIISCRIMVSTGRFHRCDRSGSSCNCGRLRRELGRGSDWVRRWHSYGRCGCICASNIGRSSWLYPHQGAEQCRSRCCELRRMNWRFVRCLDHRYLRIREAVGMKDINWRVVAPILLVGVLLGWLAVWRSAGASNALLPWIVLGPPIVLAVVAFIAVVSWLRRRKSSRTWDLMLREDPDAMHFITYVFPSVKIQLDRLGWRLHGSSFASIPAVGVSVGSTDLTFWEAGAAGPTLVLAASDIESATGGRVSDGYRGHPAIDLRLRTENRSNRLQLNLRDVQHRNASPAEMIEVIRRVRVMKRP